MTARKIPELKFKYCPFCFTELVLDNDKDAYYVCSNDTCRTEVWHDPMDTASDAKHVQQEFTEQYLCLSQVHNKTKGGSKSGKKYGSKKRMKKPTTHQIYERLCDK